MPELPEVQTVVDTLRPLLVGRAFARVEHLRRDVVRPAGFDLGRSLAGRVVTSVTRRAKRVIIDLDTGERFYIHLGMTGRLTISNGDAPIAPHTHLIAKLGSSCSDVMQTLRFVDPRRFGGIFWLGAENPHADSALGPEPLELRTSTLHAALSRTRRLIKTALLDQRLIAGLGNIYVDESLFAARLHPARRACDLSGEEVRRLNRAIKLTLRTAIRGRGSTLRDYVDANGAGGSFQRLHRVYDREGDTCQSCRRRAIVRIVIGGRSTHFCPACQPRRRSSRARHDGKSSG